jgi:stress response protein SCP2
MNKKTSNNLNDKIFMLAIIMKIYFKKYFPKMTNSFSNTHEKISLSFNLLVELSQHRDMILTNCFITPYLMEITII